MLSRKKLAQIERRKQQIQIASLLDRSADSRQPVSMVLAKGSIPQLPAILELHYNLEISIDVPTYRGLLRAVIAGEFLFDNEANVRFVLGKNIDTYRFSQVLAGHVESIKIDR